MSSPQRTPPDSPAAGQKLVKVAVTKPVRRIVAPSCRVSVSQRAPEAEIEEDRSHSLVEPLLRLMEEVQELQERQRSGLHELQELAVELAIEVAQRITRTCIDRGAYGVDRLVEEIVETLRPHDSLTVQLNPEDIASISEAARTTGVGGKPVHFRANPDIQRGECRADTAELCLTSRIHTQLHQIRSKLLQNLDNAQSERRQIADTASPLQRFPDRRATG